MQKWEYLVVELTYEGNWLIARYVNEQELEGWKNVPLPRLINRLGEAGWELVGTLSDSRSLREGGHLFFKRPRIS
jgi:Domain of unknown function (DUF4177)